MIIITTMMIRNIININHQSLSMTDYYHKSKNNSIFLIWIDACQSKRQRADRRRQADSVADRQTDLDGGGDDGSPDLTGGRRWGWESPRSPWEPGSGGKRLR